MTIFHEGELLVQERAGVSEMAASVGQSIQPYLTPYIAKFLLNQQAVYVGTADRQGHLWASPLIGGPDFIQILNEQAVRLRASAFPHDPLADNLIFGENIGLLGIELETRRRVRLNGSIQNLMVDSIDIATIEVYGNCPKYIQKRHPVPIDEPLATTPVHRGERLTAAQQAWIGQADTFFIASAHPGSGIDMSHRGGQPGFVRVEGDTRLLWPDYAGNMMFNTLGNIAVNPQVGLLFLDFERGSTLQLTGRAEIIWDETCVAQFTGAERVLAFDLEAAVEMEAILPWRWQLAEYSPFNPK